MMNKPMSRITLIFLGSAIYWVGYCGFFKYLQNALYSSLSLILVVTGLLLAGWNSSSLYRGK
jgi:hypothetical protein